MLTILQETLKKAEHFCQMQIVTADNNSHWCIIKSKLVNSFFTKMLCKYLLEELVLMQICMFNIDEKFHVM